MLKEFAKHIEELKPTYFTTKDDEFVVNGGKARTVGAAKKLEAMEVEREEEALRREMRESLPATLNVSTLTGVMDYLVENPDGYINPDRKAIIHIASTDKVDLYCQMDAVNDRPHLVHAQAYLPNIKIGNRIDREEFIISLQTQYADTDDRNAMIGILSHLKEGAEKEIIDNGFSQTVAVKKGVATVEQQAVPCPAKLAPFRTFIEAEQPRSYYVVRLHDNGMISINDASGGEWKVQAIAAIRKWFMDNIPEEIKKDVFIIA